jgi:hypothetical protein
MQFQANYQGGVMTKRIQSRVLLSLIGVMVLRMVLPLTAGETKEIYTGSAVSVGGTVSGQLASTTFNLTIEGYTSDEEAQRYLTTLAEEKQDGLLKAISKQKLGFFSLSGQVGRTINVVRVHNLEEGKRKIVVVFERWLKMAEVRNGYRSRDYPFGVIEIVMDPDGKGEGTYVGAAKIRWVTDDKTGKKTVEIENFATYPTRLMGVMKRSK